MLERNFRRVVRHFALNFTASNVGELTGLTRKSVTSIFLRIRERIAEEFERQSPFGGEVEVERVLLRHATRARQEGLRRTG